MSQRSRLLASLVPLAFVATLAGCTSATDEDEDVGTAEADVSAARRTPTVAAYFNHPTAANGWTSPELFERLALMVDATPRGETIRVAVVTLGSSNLVVDRLIAAHRRGVTVQMVTDRDTFAAPNGIVQKRLASELGTDTGAGSWIGACGVDAARKRTRARASCNGESESANNHNKFVLFSRTGDERDVTWVGSTNLTASQLHSWNNAAVFKNDRKMFDRFLTVWKTFVENIRDPSTPPRPRLAAVADGAANGNYAMFTPDDRKTDALERFFDAIACDRARNHTIQISMHEFSNSRVELARALAQSGCRVQLVSTFIGWKIREIFGAHERLEMTRLVSFDPRIGSMNHDKYVVVFADYTAGRVDGRNCTRASPCRNTKQVLTGSHNWSDRGMSNNDESLVRITDDAGVFAAYRDNFRDILEEAGRSAPRELERNDESGWCTTDAQCASKSCDRRVRGAPGGYRFCR